MKEKLQAVLSQLSKQEESLREDLNVVESYEAQNVIRHMIQENYIISVVIEQIIEDCEDHKK
ncbi:hypothetical protein GJU84_11200 [Staphylococcus chromogenes]|uniref:hypothetical protein n=1 Tax=Staphylococcus chromogenes TaxID=46126 RepID=UPI0014044E37|nr:hypothetical protein [Staphylococcus chromogenes]QIN27578.1 hypothetical protein GJU84_11200 [Staphylococcus chromogenes]